MGFRDFGRSWFVDLGGASAQKEVSNDRAMPGASLPLRTWHESAEDCCRPNRPFSGDLAYPWAP